MSFYRNGKKYSETNEAKFKRPRAGLKRIPVAKFGTLCISKRKMKAMGYIRLNKKGAHTNTKKRSKGILL